MIDTIDDLVNTVALGESIQLLGRLSRSMVQKAEGTYLHGIRVEVNNVLKVSSPEDIGVPKPIESILRCKSRLSRAIYAEKMDPKAY